jgi:hypothetical protein
MSIVSVRATIECDRCKVCYTISTLNLSQVRVRARECGWTTDRRDLCPNCQRKSQQPTTQENTTP